MSVLWSVGDPVDTTPLFENSHLTPEDIASARRAAHAAPPFTQAQIVALQTLLGPLLRAQMAEIERTAA